ncbi:hypothetical protein MAPG_03837 [Magnaporthiopsis poae ATCC 64411]|uniref:Uncharacterized protein n=1 Tax=Magnaporthiopsis poae (strain ATCC 64411 / 73-15) TaxID=644358 RepID=A0A0C4DV37_MAGP6|nr:hypothetical protein MAPG_03837 [Magnaporthiopsis poae ATCC 64411]
MPGQDEQQASQPVGFPESCFFQEQRAPALPSPSEVRALNLQSGNRRGTNFRRPSPVKVPALGLLVKYGADVTQTELDTQIWVLFGWAEDGGRGFIYMALVDGKPLQELWLGMTEGSLDNRRLNEIFLRDHPNLAGPFHGPDAVRQFQDGCEIDIPPADVAVAFTDNDLLAPYTLLSPGPEPKVATIIDWA